MACPALPYFFPHNLINGTIFGEEIFLNIQCTCFFSITFEHFPFYEEFLRDIHLQRSPSQDVNET